MKFLYSSLLVLAMIAAYSSFAQTNVTFEIKHMLHGEEFKLNQETFSDLGITFDAKRLQYYISEISVTHDGGQITEFEDKYILVTANYSTNELLGDGAIDSIESISFHIGVNEPANHSDPSSYSSSHPLAHKNPEMHWGWTAGYRFVAIEGKIGAELDNSYNFHALGEDNYFETTVDIGAKASNNAVKVSIYANYANALNSLDIVDGFTLHSEIGECVTVLENFRDNVFSAEAPADTILPPVILDTTDSTDITFISESLSEDMFSVYPNPATNHVSIIATDQNFSGVLSIFGIQGNRYIQQQIKWANSTISIRELPKGAYVIEIRSEQAIVRKVLMIN